MQLGRGRDLVALVPIRRRAGSFDACKSQGEKDNGAKELSDHSDDMTSRRGRQCVENLGKEPFEGVLPSQHGLGVIDVHRGSAREVCHFGYRRIVIMGNGCSRA